MKMFHSELVHHYKTYSFGYANYALREPKDRLADIYNKGYLPYSGKPGVRDVFYMARSARIDLAAFTPSSENRRIQKKFAGTLVRTRVPFEKFDYRDEKFLSFCLTYFRKRHGKQIMPRERLLVILKTNLVTHTMIYHSKESGEAVAYVLEVSDRTMTHFWFSFYNLSYVRQSLGLWLMLDSLCGAQKKKKKYFYVGTVYGDKALYKTNFRALEYWNGEKWTGDIKTLKHLARNDASREVSLNDLWKGA